MNSGNDPFDELIREDNEVRCAHLQKGDVCVLWKISQTNPGSPVRDAHPIVDGKGHCRALDASNWATCPEYISGPDWWRTAQDSIRNGPFGGGSPERE